MRLLKITLWGLFLALSAPLAALSLGGRLRAPYLFGAHCAALFPGLPGDYFRIAYYRWTLEACDLESRVSFGSFFAHPQVRLGRRVYIGPYCVIGRAAIGDRCQIATGVQILSGAKQHGRDPQGGLLGAEHGAFSHVTIGEDCWLGAACIVMADMGPRSTVGAGAIVTRPVAAGVTVVGNPARPLAPKQPAAAE